MNRIAKIINSATPGAGIQFRKDPYGNRGIRRFLRDVIAIANAAVEGSRYIIVGAGIDKSGRKRLASVAQNDFSGNPPYQKLVSDFIEPRIHLTYKSAILDGKRVGVFEIGECQDRPYMMRVDHSEKLRRGDAYIRIDNSAIKMGRRQLQDLFEKRFRDSVSADRIEIGFPGEIIHKDLKIATVDLAQIPSTVARAKLKQLLDIQANARNTGTTTGLIRLAHARLYGSDDPYETWTPAKLMKEMAKLEAGHQLDDLHFLYETRTTKLQLVVYNQGDEPIKDATLSIILPRHDAFYVADQLPLLLRNGKYEERRDDEKAAYPTIKLTEDAMHISNTLGDVPTELPVNAFGSPLRICAGSELKGRKLGIRYSLLGRNLRNPAKGKLRLLLS